MTGEQLRQAMAGCEEPDPKRYTPDNTSAEDVAAIQASLFVFEPGILFWRETVFQTRHSVDLLLQSARRQTEHWEHLVYVVDLTRATRPSAAAREALKDMFLLPNLRFTALYTEANFFLNVAAKFVLSSVVNTDRFIVVKSQQNAIDVALREVEQTRPFKQSGT